MNETQTQMGTTLKEGQRFFYTGDMANCSTFGTILDVQNTKYGLNYHVEFDNERFDGDSRFDILYEYSFDKGVGQRFKTIEQFNQERINEMAAHGYDVNDIELAK
jgi:hypothetical protein